MDFGGVGADEEVEIIEGFQPKKTPPTHHPDVGSDSDVTSAAGAPIGAAVPPVSAASGSMALLEDRLRQSLEDPTAATNTNTNRNKNTNNALQQLQQLDAAIASSAIAAAAADTAAAASKPASRRMIPKKAVTSIDLPTPAYRERNIVHPAERPPPLATKKFRFNGAKHSAKSSNGDTSPNGEPRVSIFDRASSDADGRMLDDAAWQQRQRQIETGQMTPFAAIGGKEKTFTRVATQKTIAPPAASSAAAASHAGTSLPVPFAHSSSQRPAQTKARSIPRKTDLNTGRTKNDAKPKKLTKGKSPSKSGKKRKHRSSSDDDDDGVDVDDGDGDGAFVPRPSPSPWSCSACTFLNPSDFSNRCEVCHTVRVATTTMTPKATAATKKRKIKREDGESKYIELTDDEDADETPRSSNRKSASKRSSIDSDGAYELGGSPSSSDLDESDSDDPVDAAFQREDDLLDAEDGEEQFDDDEMMTRFEKRGRRASRFIHDDYDTWRYEERVDAFRDHQRAEEAARLAAGSPSNPASPDDPNSSLDVAFDGGFILPAFIWNRLFAYQKTCIKWLWELHAQNVGGIIADEMGLGKTIQVIGFLAGLHYSSHHSSSTSPAGVNQFHALPPTLVIVPATILSQWLREFHEWSQQRGHNKVTCVATVGSVADSLFVLFTRYPDMRVFVLHDSIPHDASVSRRDIVSRVFSTGGVLITTYQSIRTCKHLLLHREWGYVILDEGHKIKSPDATITLLVKQLLSIHRIILTGSPIQNSLVELWSLFDFIFPGKLGTLPIFEDEFVGPILQGGYTSATPVQIQLAYKCALILRDLINPYILRRQKCDVAQMLPPKTEQVLFCNLTPEQHKIYRRFLDAHAKDISEIVEGKLSLFRVIHFLRKICNHADLLELKIKGSKNNNNSSRSDSYAPAASSGSDYGSVDRSGKLKVVQQVLRLWKDQGHRCLLFSQTQQMLDIIEAFVRKEGYIYRRMDGSTSIKQRLPLIDEFNHDSSIFIMLLTTRAGGLGVNLTGANRVIMYDPDWNPACDAQARERAYRIGQSRQVTVYRLITRGCIEEKVYHRQIWKQFLTDKVLRDPKQKRFFSNHDIKDLFALAPLHTPPVGSKHAAPTETANIFKGTGGVIDQQEVMEQERDRINEQQQRARIKAEQNAADSSSPPPSHPIELEEGEIPPDSPPINTTVKHEATDQRTHAEPAPNTMPSNKLYPPPSTAAPPLDIADYDEPTDDPPVEQSGSDDNNRILAALFSRAGIQSAMDHDAILGASSQQEKSVIASIADKVATRAVAALKRSRQAMRDAPVNAPTWTGRNGAAGAPNADRPRFGLVARKPAGTPVGIAHAAATPIALAEQRLRAPNFDGGDSSASAAAAAYNAGHYFDSSTSGFATSAASSVGGGSAGLLARLRGRAAVSSQMATHTGMDDADVRELVNSTGRRRSPTTPLEHDELNSAGDSHLSLADALRARLAASPAGLTSSELVTLFGSSIGPLEADKLIFRQMLRRVAVLTGKGKREPGRWRLKTEFE